MVKTPAPEHEEFRLHPQRPRAVRDESKAWSRSFKSLIRFVRMTSKAAPSTRDHFGPGGDSARRTHLQRCAVRVTYSPNRVRGQRAAHGRYIARESAARESDVKGAGFSAATDRVDVAKTMNAWQAAGDQRLFKLIISPEFGERLDLRRHTRELVARMEHDLGQRLEWVAVAHFNTDHSHVHVALRGHTGAGPLRLARDYIKQGIRRHAENLCTTQLGFRTQVDALEGERREIHPLHVTSLDRAIARHAFGPVGDGTFEPASSPSGNSEFRRAHQQFLASRLRTLATVELARPVDAGRFQIDPAFLAKLRAMQIGADRQKLKAAGMRRGLATIAR